MIERSSSLLYWYPLLEVLPISMPKTEIVKIPYGNLMGLIDGEDSLKEYADEIDEAADKIGYPLFLRTDLCSGKHRWEKTCFVASKEVLYENIFGVVEANASADILGLPCKALIFREFLDLDWRFKAFHGRMPVARERRYFIRDGEIICRHPYWIEDAIADWYDHAVDFAERFDGPKEKLLGDTPKNWKDLLKEINYQSDDEIEVLDMYAHRVASVLDGSWSVDFAYTKNHLWFLIDMALAHVSYHPPCPQKETFDLKGEV